ncbi:hypothetical protein SprV_0401487500 [Sparganum proliferum]
MYAEECGIEASAPFVQNFYESCLKFLRRLEKSTEPLKVIKAPSNNISTNAPADGLKRFHTLQTPQYHSPESQMDHDSLSGRHRCLSSNEVTDAQTIPRIRPRPPDATPYSTTNSTIEYAPGSLSQPSANHPKGRANPESILLVSIPTLLMLNASNGWRKFQTPSSMPLPEPDAFYFLKALRFHTMFAK